MTDKAIDTQVIELIGRNRLGSELLHAGLEVAVPARDRGIDLIAYSDLSSSTEKFVARPIQMKAASKRSFSLFQKYAKFADLIIAYLWFIEDPKQTVTYALTYDEALSVATKIGWTETKSWAREGYSTTNPSVELCELIQPFQMTPDKWWRKVTGLKSKTNSQTDVEP
jgi:hypothetical protein